MIRHLKTATLMLAAMTLLTGVVYPLAVTAVARLVFPYQASGSFVSTNGTRVGSELIGQPFSEPRYFWGRLSATSPYAYNAASSSGSNLGPLNPALQDAVKARVDALREADPQLGGAIPVDLVTSSGSGLDPHISPAAAEVQVRRVAKARALSEDKVRQLVEQATEGRQLGVLGEARVNVLQLNLALNRLTQ